MTMLAGTPLFLAEVTIYDPAISAERVLRYGSSGYATGANTRPANTYYDGRISQPVDVTRNLFTGGDTSGGSRIGIGDLVLLNGDAELDFLLTCGVDGRVLTIWRSEIANPAYPADFERIFVGTMDHLEYDTDTVTVKIRDRLLEMTAPVQTNKYLGNNALPNGLEGVATDLQGRPKPLAFGVVTNIAPPCVNTSKLIYQVNDGAVNTVDHVYDRGIALTVGAVYATLTDLLDDASAPAAGAFKQYPSLGYFRLGSSPDGQITADVTQGNSSADRTAAQMFSQLLQRRALANPNAQQLGEVLLIGSDGASIVGSDGAQIIGFEDVSNADLIALDAVNHAVLGLYVDTDSAIADCCDLVANSVGAWWGVDQAGVFRIRQFTEPTADTPVATITDNDTLKPLVIVATNDVGGGLPVYRCTVQWGQSYTVQTTDLAAGVTDARKSVVAQQYRSAVATDTGVQMRNLLAPETIEPSLLTTLADAQAEATRRLTLRRVLRQRYEIVVPLTKEFAAIDLGDVVEFAYPRFGLNVAGHDTLGCRCRVLDIVPDAKNNSITLTLWGAPSSTYRNVVGNTGTFLVGSDGAFVIGLAA